MTGLSPWMDAGGKHLAEEEDEGVRRTFNDGCGYKKLVERYRCLEKKKPRSLN